MRNNDHGAALVTHAAQDGEELVRFLWREHSRRLIEDQDVRASVKHLENLNRLLFTNGHVVGFFQWVNFQTIFLTEGSDFSCQRFFSQAAIFFRAHDNVVLRSENIHQLEMLVDHADAERQRIMGGSDRAPLAPNVDCAAIRMVNAG